MTRKLQNLLTTFPRGLPLTSTYLKQQGYSPSLQKQYRDSGHLESVGFGASKFPDDELHPFAGIAALQKQLGLQVHIGGRSALLEHGISQYGELGRPQKQIYRSPGTSLPKWFLEYDWGFDMHHHQVSFLPDDVGFTELDCGGFNVRIPTELRAFLECLYLVPSKQDFYETYELLEFSFDNTTPQEVQNLLEKCNSIKVKRLFLYLSDKLNKPWMDNLDLNKIYLGSGKRQVVKYRGMYNSKWKLVVPDSLETRYWDDCIF